MAVFGPIFRPIGLFHSILDKMSQWHLRICSHFLFVKCDTVTWNFPHALPFSSSLFCHIFSSCFLSFSIIFLSHFFLFFAQWKMKSALGLGTILLILLVKLVRWPTLWPLLLILTQWKQSLDQWHGTGNAFYIHFLQTPNALVIFNELSKRCKLKLWN